MAQVGPARSAIPESRLKIAEFVELTAEKWPAGMTFVFAVSVSTTIWCALGSIGWYLL